MSASWSGFVRETIGPDKQALAAEKVDVDQTTVSRWINDANPRVTPETARALARAYGVSVLDAFVAAGFLTAEEAHSTQPRRVDLQAIPLKRLVFELDRRLKDIDPAVA